MDYSSYYPPQKRALADDVLAEVLADAQRSENGMMAAMQLLEEQANLRAEDQKDLNAWVARMQAEGSARSAHALENYRLAEAGQPTTEYVEPASEPVLEPEPVSEPEPASEPESEPLPLWASQFSTGGFDMIIAEEDSEEEVIVEIVAEQAVYEEFIAPDFSQTQIAESNTAQFETILDNARIAVADDVADEIFVPEPVSKPSVLTTIERRSKPLSQLWVWSGISLGLGPVLLAVLVNSLGLAFSESLAAVAIGILLSSGLIAIGTLAGKRSGLQTLLLSRAAFGVFGNLFAAIPIVLTKIFWLVIITLAGLSIFNDVIDGAPSLSDSAFALGGVEIKNAAVAVAAFAIVSSLLAFFGGKILYRAQQVVAIISFIASVLFIALTANSLNFDALGSRPSAGALSLIAASTVVFTCVGAVWVAAGAEFARKLPMRVSGKRVILFTKLGAGVLPLMIAAYALAVIAALPGYKQRELTQHPVITIASMLPAWAAAALLVSGLLSLVIWLASAFYSASVSLHSTGFKLRPSINQPILIAVLLAIIVPATTLITGDLFVQAAAYVPLASVVVTAWAGVFVVDVGLRRIAYHEVSLSRDYGFYKSFNWPNIIGFVLALALGVGFISVPTIPVLGYAAQLLGVVDFANAQIGVFIALFFSALFPLLFGIKRIKQQEAEVVAIESRRDDLKDVLL